MPGGRSQIKMNATKSRRGENGKKGIFEFLESVFVCLFINVLGEVTTVALLLELEHEWGRAGSG